VDQDTGAEYKNLLWMSELFKANSSAVVTERAHPKGRETTCRVSPAGGRVLTGGSFGAGKKCWTPETSPPFTSDLRIPVMKKVTSGATYPELQ